MGSRIPSAQHQQQAGQHSQVDAAAGHQPRSGLSWLQRSLGNQAFGRLVRQADPAMDPVSLAQPRRGAGQSLDPATRAFMESRFGHDFSGVRLHTDTPAAASAKAVRARAYTVGRDIVFAAGAYAPATAGGRRLLAHELTHVVQQSRAGSEAGWEMRAESAAGAVASGLVVSPTQVGSAPLGLHRAGENGEKTPSILSGMTQSSLLGFDPHSATLKNHHPAQITMLAATLRLLLSTNSMSTITVIGYADLADGEGRIQIARQRAETVRDVLARLGIPAWRMYIAAIDTADSRRVDVHCEQALLPPVPPLFPDAPPKIGEDSIPDRVRRNLTGPRPPVSTPLEAPKLTEKMEEHFGTPKVVQNMEAQPKAGGRALKAISEIPEVKKFITEATGRAARDLQGLTTPIGQTPQVKFTDLPLGEKIQVGSSLASTLVPLGAGALATIASDPAIARTVLGLVHGMTIEVPGADWLRVEVRTKDEATDVIRLNLVKLASRLTEPEQSTSTSRGPSDQFSTEFSGGVAMPTGGAATWQARLYYGVEFQRPVLSLFNPTLGFGLGLIGESMTTGIAPAASPQSFLLSVLPGFRITTREPAAAGSSYLQLFGGPAIALPAPPGSLVGKSVPGASPARAGSEAGIAVGYRWRVIDISTRAGHAYDPSRKEGLEHMGTFSVGVSFVF